MKSDHIKIFGARQHNLKNISLEIPKEKLVVITGVSGSGKSSLAFDTIYSEGQRRYIESLSAYARQFLDQMEKADVDVIEGLSPAIAVAQKATNHNPRSTVGTITEIYDYLRLLFASIGVPYSPATGLPIMAQSLQEMLEIIHKNPPGTKLMLLAPIVKDRKGQHKQELKELARKGFSRIRVNDELIDLTEEIELAKNKKHTIELVIDSFKYSPELEERLIESLETALNIAKGVCYLYEEDNTRTTIFSRNYSCPVSGFTIEELNNRMFSFNSVQGACESCGGLGFAKVFDVAEFFDYNISLEEGAFLPWKNTKNLANLVRFLSTKHKISMPFNDLDKSLQKNLLEGSEVFLGFIPWLKLHVARDKLEKEKVCTDCKGYRLRPESLAVKIAGKHIGEISVLTISEAATWIEGLQLGEQEKQISALVIKEISSRLGFLRSVGLEYLSLNRTSGTLSGGESQRIRLASQIGSGLTGVLYILDEPSIGLHQADNDRLLASLKNLRDLGNTVIVVEHDEDTMRESDFIVDIGPGAGVHGGQVVAIGTPLEIINNSHSITGQFLRGDRKIDLPTKRRSLQNHITLRQVNRNNLKGFDIDFPLEVMVCITGVSGSGKSSLVLGEFVERFASLLPNKRLVEINQQPIGRTPRSNPATYTGIFDLIRDWFAKLPESRARGYNVGRFSFNSRAGCCIKCSGDGVLKIEMHFLPDVYVVCKNCNGKRYNSETLSIKFNGKAISDILDMTITEAGEFFKEIAYIAKKLKLLEEVGLGYMKLGQSSTTLSGGEAQRIKLAKELTRSSMKENVYIFDEPTTGLHFADIEQLLKVIQRLVDSGASVYIIEHNLEVIKCADWVIDLGPQGGKKGGEIVATGTPEEISLNSKSLTGRYLKKYLMDV